LKARPTPSALFFDMFAAKVFSIKLNTKEMRKCRMHDAYRLSIEAHLNAFSIARSQMKKNER
jgi:hypothetical protein